MPLVFPGNNPQCTGVVWFVKVRRTAMGWRGMAELERVGHWRYVNVCKSCDPDGSLLWRTRLFPQQPGPTTQSVKSSKYLGPGFFSWPLSYDPQCGLSSNGGSWWTMTTTTTGEAESPGRWPPDVVFQASLQAPCLHLLNLSLCLALWTAASAVCSQLASQPESFYVALPTGSLFGSRANINRGLHLFKESMPVPLPRTTFFLTLLCPNLTPQT